MRTTYEPLDTAPPPLPALKRQVNYRLATEFMLHPPRCAALWLRPGRAPAAVANAVSLAVQRHLGLRFRRVLGAAATALEERRLGLELGEPSARRVFARQTGCETLAEIRLDQVTDAYFVIWSERAIGLTLRLIRPGRPERVLWTARHRALRGDGGLPLSVFSLPMTLARAASLKGDGEAFASIADDAVRRMTATLPDVRAAWPDSARRLVSSSKN
jgi:hypothetical protein